MIALLQRVTEASVSVDGKIVGAIGRGVLALLGVERGDSEAEADRLLEKIATYRIFPDDAGKMNRSVLEMGGGVLVISQFTLHGDARKGRRPAFTGALEPIAAEALYDDVLRKLLAAGVFRAHMQVELVNDGPVTILLDSRKTF